MARLVLCQATFVSGNGSEGSWPVLFNRPPLRAVPAARVGRIRTATKRSLPQPQRRARNRSKYEARSWQVMPIIPVVVIGSGTTFLWGGSGGRMIAAAAKLYSLNPQSMRNSQNKSELPPLFHLPLASWDIAPRGCCGSRHLGRPRSSFPLIQRADSRGIDPQAHKPWSRGPFR